MKDKELTELAAKAAGKNGKWDGAVFVLDSPAPDECSAWHPLHDDGDALRLATELDFNIYHAARSVFVEDLDQGIEVAVGHEKDKFAATRRAIVMAAAQISTQS